MTAVGASILISIGVGKSTLLRRLTENRFPDDAFATQGMDYYVIRLKLGDKIVKL